MIKIIEILLVEISWMDDIYGSYVFIFLWDIWNGGGCVKDKINVIMRMFNEI